jgi:hypothetical protein
MWHEVSTSKKIIYKYFLKKKFEKKRNFKEIFTLNLYMCLYEVMIVILNIKKIMLKNGSLEQLKRIMAITIQSIIAIVRTNSCGLK